MANYIPRNKIIIQTNKTMKYTIKEETLNAVLNYLVQQQYKDVAVLIQLIQSDLSNKEEKEGED